MNELYLDKQLSRYGLCKYDLVKCGNYDGPTILGKSGAGANIKPAKVMKTSDLQELKKWTGVENECYDCGDIKHHMEVPAYDPDDFVADDMNSLSEEQRDKLVKGAEAYVWGHSDRASQWKSTVEKYLAPFSVPVFAVQDITVKPGSPWIIDGPPPQVINVGTITVEAGGEIIIKSSATVNADKLDQQA
jgi:hypothetical protein